MTIYDMEGIAHTVEVTAATLYEAVAIGLKQIRGNDWVEGIAGGLNTVSVSVKNVQVEHQVRIADFTKWIEREVGHPAEVIKRKRIRGILGFTDKS